MLLHQVVEDLGHLTAGNVTVGLEAAVAVAIDDPLPHHGPDVVGGVSGDLGAVGKGQVRQRIALCLGAADHGGGLRPRQGAAGIEIQLSVLLRAGDDALGVQSLHRGNGIRRDAAKVRKGQGHIGVLVLIQLQIAVEHDGKLCPADILVGAEGTIAVAGGDVGVVEEIHIVGSPVVADIIELVIHAGGIDIHAGPTDIAGSIHSGHGDAGCLLRLAGGGQIVLECAVLDIVTLQRLPRIAVHGHGDGGLGQNAVHPVGDLHIHRPVLPVQRGRHHRGRVVHRAGERTNYLVNVDRAGAGGIGVFHCDTAVIGVGRGWHGDFQPGEGKVPRQCDADLLPAGEVQQGNGQSQVALSVPGIEEGKLIAGAVTVNPEVQGGIVVSQVEETAGRNGQPLRICAEGVIQLTGIVTPLDVIAGIGAGDCEIGAAGEDQVGIFKVLYRFKGLFCHGDGNGQALITGGDRQAAGAGSCRCKHAVFIHRADIAGGRPCKRFGIRTQRQMVPDSSGGECGFAAGSHGQRGQAGRSVFQRQGIRGADSMNHGTAAAPPFAGRHGDVATAGRGGQRSVFQRSCAGGEVIAGVHGNIIRIHAGDVHRHAAARQHIVAGGLDVEVVQPPTGAVGGHQKDLIGDLAVGFGGAVDDGRIRGVRGGHGQIGGAAAVQTQHRLAAQLQQPLTHLRQRCADGVAASAAVDGVEHQRAVRLLPHGGAGIHPGGQAGGHCAVFRKAVQRAHRVLHIVPARVGGNGQRHLAAGGHIPQGVGVVSVRIGVGGEDDLIRLDGSHRGLLHPLHAGRDRGADGKLPLLHGADHVDACLRGAGGMSGVEIISIQEHTAVGAGLVHRDDRADQLHRAAGAVVHGVAQIDADLNAGLSQHGGAVRPEADGVIPGVAAAEDTVRDYQPDGQAGGHIVKVAVDPGHHPVALPFQRVGRIRHAGTVRQHAAVGDDGGDGFIGAVGDEVFRPEIGIGGTPEHIGGQLGFLMDHRVLGGQILPQRLRRGGRQAQRPQQAEGQQQGCHFADAGFHSSLLCSTGPEQYRAVYITP